MRWPVEPGPCSYLYVFWSDLYSSKPSGSIPIYRTQAFLLPRLNCLLPTPPSEPASSEAALRRAMAASIACSWNRYEFGI